MTKLECYKCGVELWGGNQRLDAQELCRVVSWQGQKQALLQRKLDDAHSDAGQRDHYARQNALLDLLREAAPKCDGCGEIATWARESTPNEDCYHLTYACDRHLTWLKSGLEKRHRYLLRENGLGQRIKAALE